MLKPQDIVVLLKLLAKKEYGHMSQKDLAKNLCVSHAVINESLKRLIDCGLVHREKHRSWKKPIQHTPNLKDCADFLILGVKYFFRAQFSQMTVGFPTSYASAVMRCYTCIDRDPIPVWPFAEGEYRGIGLIPLYPCVPMSIHKFPDVEFYDLLCLVDVLRHGNRREYNKAAELLRERIQSYDER